MQVETSLRSPAWAIHRSKLVKTFVFRATSVPTRTESTMASASARTPQTTPAAAWPGFVAPRSSPGQGDQAQDSCHEAAE